MCGLVAYWSSGLRVAPGGGGEVGAVPEPAASLNGPVGLSATPCWMYEPGSQELRPHWSGSWLNQPWYLPSAALNGAAPQEERGLYSEFHAAGSSVSGSRSRSEHCSPAQPGSQTHLELVQSPARHSGCQ